MGLLDGLEKLINEHGSAAILKERISLLNERHAEVDRKLREAEAKCAALLIERDELLKKLEAATQGAPPAAELSKQRLNVLRFICNANGQDVFARQAGQALGLDEERAAYELAELAQGGLLNENIWAGYGLEAGKIGYSISHTGRKHLVERGLL
jgi:hypothetical protein